MTDERIDTRAWISDVTDDDLWIIREAVGFYLSIVAEREKAGYERYGTIERVEDFAYDLGIGVEGR